MLHAFEKIILYIIRWFYELGSSTGLFLFMPAIAVLFFLQFKRGKNAYHIPGIIGTVLVAAALYHLLAAEKVTRAIDTKLYEMNLPAISKRPPIPIAEPVFTLFIGPYGQRAFWEELLLVVALTWLAWFFYFTRREYKKTGKAALSLSVTEMLDKAKHKRPKRSETNELGSGDLATRDQIAKWTKSNAPELDTKLPVTNLRGSEGVAFRNAELVIPNEQRNRHLLAVAKTGGGKTTKLILPILYNDCLSKVRSTVVLDSKPEMWRYLAMMTRTHNPAKNIVLFNPLDPARSLSWNILSKIEDPTDAKLIANTIIMATDVPSAKSDSPFFRNNALAVLYAVMVGLLHDKEEKKDTLSMPRIHEIIQSGMKGLCDWLERHPHAIRTSRAFVELARSGSQNADTIMSELSMRISQWDLPDIRATTAFDELDLEKLVLEPTLFIIELRESELEMLRPLANVIIIEILRFLTKYAEKCPGSRLPRPVSLVIDEFASALGRLPDIHVKLNTLRSRNVSICAAIQSTGQIKANYGDDADSVLAGFNTKIFMPTLDIADAEWASKETGQMTIRFQTASQGSNRKIIEWFASKNDSTQEQVQQRAVLTPDEIGRPVDGISTFFLPDTPVFQGFLTPFYKMPEMLARLTEFNSEEHELKLRAAPIDYKEKLPDVAQLQNTAQGGAGGLPPGISNTKGWSEEQLLEKLTETKKKLDWDNTTGSARKWWEAFENENKHRNALVLRLAEELANRNATITEFFLAYVYSNTDNIQANLHYLDYTRLKKEEERKRREAAEKEKAA
jgi:type IV secretion system protein VirD4